MKNTYNNQLGVDRLYKLIDYKYKQKSRSKRNHALEWAFAITYTYNDRNRMKRLERASIINGGQNNEERDGEVGRLLTDEWRNGLWIVAALVYVPQQCHGDYVNCQSIAHFTSWHLDFYEGVQGKKVKTLNFVLIINQHLIKILYLKIM